MAEPGEARARLRRALANELGIYRSLARWVARRPSIPAGTEPVGYARLVTPVLWLFIGGSAVEVVVVDVLLPWTWVRIVAAVLGIWGVLWMLGVLAGYRVHPHLLSDDTLRVRNGATIDVAIAWDAIASARTDELDLPTSMRSLQPLETDGGTHLRVGVSGRVNVRVVLREPTTVTTPQGPMEVVEVAFWVDDPRDVVAVLRGRIGARRGG